MKGNNRWLKYLPYFSLLLGLPAFSSEPTASQALEKTSQTKPNIIYFLADDLGIGDLGSYGQSKIRTPNIDQLAKEGMKFTQHYSGSTVCAPSRASLMTGLDTGHVNVRGNYQAKENNNIAEQGQLPLPPNSHTIPKIMKAAGYITGAYGKWGLGSINSSGSPLKQGFDYFYGYLDQRNAHNYFPLHLWSNEQLVMLDNDKIIIKLNRKDKLDENAAGYHKFIGKDYAPYRIMNQANKFIRQHKDQPFFLYVPFVVPHAALQIPDKELAGYEFNEFPHTANGKGGYTPHPKPRAARAAMISRMDRDIGNVMTLLKELDIDDNTLVFFTSDNGATSVGGSDIEFFNSTKGYRGEKRDLYEGGIRAPMIARWPGKIKANSQSEHVSAFWDMLVTFADISNQSLVSDSQGISFLPSLLGKQQQQHKALYWEFHHPKPAQAVRMGKYKGIKIYPTKVNKLTSAKFELYDLSIDPYEQYNIAASHNNIIQKMQVVMNNRVKAKVKKWNFYL